MANIYVDQITEYPPKKGLRWLKWSHLMTDGSLGELHVFAKKCGLKLEWFQSKPYPHYDITHHKRPLAIALGAIETTTREQIRIFKRLADKAQGGKEGE